MHPLRSTSPRLLHIVLSMGVGGVERGVQNIIQGLDAQGLSQAVICVESLGNLSEQLPESVPIWDCKGGNGHSKVRVLAEVAKRVREFRPNVVHARNCTAWLYGGLGWQFAGSPGRLVFSIHGLDWSGSLPRRTVVALRYMSRRTTKLLAVSERTADAFAVATGIPSTRFSVMHSGVDLRRFRPRSTSPGPASQGPCKIACVARLADRKGHDVLLKAFSILHKAGCRDFEALIVGDGPLREPLISLAHRLGISSLVTFIGEVDDVASVLQGCSIFVLPSLSEGRPTSIMEAMGVGLPVVATRVGAVESQVVDGLTGLLVEPGDATGLVQALAKLMSNAQLRRTFGERGRGVAEARFSHEDMVVAYLRQYQSICGPE